MQPWFMTLPYFHWVQGKEILYHEMRFEKDSRYYVIRLEKDLLGDWTIMAINGRIKSKLGQSRTFAYDDFEQAFDNFCLFVKVRHQRKYQLTSYKTRNPLFLHWLIALLNTAELYPKPPKKINHPKTRGTKQKPAVNLSDLKPNLHHNYQIPFDFN